MILYPHDGIAVVICAKCFGTFFISIWRNAKRNCRRIRIVRETASGVVFLDSIAACRLYICLHAGDLIQTMPNVLWCIPLRFDVQFSRLSQTRIALCWDSHLVRSFCTVLYILIKVSYHHMFSRQFCIRCMVLLQVFYILISPDILQHCISNSYLEQWVHCGPTKAHLYNFFTTSLECDQLWRHPSMCQHPTACSTISR